MPTKMIRQSMFSTGEVDEQTWKRTDVQEYLTAARSLLNCEVGTTGLVRKRKGTRYSIDVTDKAILNSRMYEFIDKEGNYYLIMSANNCFYIFDAPAQEDYVVKYDGTEVVTRNGANVVASDLTLSFFQKIEGTPYIGSDLNQADYTEVNDALVISHPNYPPGRIFIDNYTTFHFAFEYLNTYPLPSYDFGAINYNNYAASIGGDSNNMIFVLKGLGANPGFDNAWIGGQVIGAGANVDSPIGYGIITGVAYDNLDGGRVVFTGPVQVPFKLGGDSATHGSQYSIRQPAWVKTPGDPYGLGYPSKVAFYQNRLWFGNTKKLPNTVFSSKINQLVSFDVGTGRDTYSIVYTIGQTGTGEINWLNGGKQLEIYTQNYEFSCPQDQNSGLTPSTFSVRQQSSYGSSSILKPQNYINDSYFAAKTGKAFINYRFTGVGLSYQSSNISIPSTHLVKNPSNRALLRGSDTSQDNFMYFLNQDDDTITAFQFAMEYRLAALTPITFQDNVELIDIVTVNNQVYILKYYNLTGHFSIESFDQNERMDSAQNYVMTASGQNSVITGLDRFNGYTVQIVYEGQDFGEYPVTAGTIVVLNTGGITDTAQVGLLYDVEIKPMYPFAGSEASPFMKNISQIYVDYYQSLNFYINGKLVPYQSFVDIQQGNTLVPRTGTEIIGTANGWGRFDDESIVITQTSPFDLEILSISYQIDVAVI